VIHPSRLPARRPPTVAEFIKQLQGCPQDALVVARVSDSVDALAPHPKKKTIYRAANGMLFFSKMDVDDNKLTHVKVVVL
jgi:hypothetical protein